MKTILGYMAVILLTIYCFFLYDDRVLAMLLVIETFYFAFAFVWVSSSRKKVQIYMEPLLPIAEKGQTISVKVIVKHPQKERRVRVKIYLCMENSFTEERKKIKKMITVCGGQKKEVIFDLQSKECGNIVISLKKYVIYDLLYLLGWTVKCRESQSVGILPECHLLPVEVTRRTREFIAEAEEYSDKESGDDPSEVYQIRPYQNLDSLRDVHWKLSAKAEELLVKEHGKPKGCVVLIWLNLQTDLVKIGQTSTEILETVASLALSLLEAECVHMVAWYEKENQRIQKKSISKEEHVYELLNRLLFTKMYQEDITEIYERTFRGIYFSTIVELKTDGSVLINGEEKMKLSLIEGENRWEDMYFII